MAMAARRSTIWQSQPKCWRSTPTPSTPDRGGAMENEKHQQKKRDANSHRSERRTSVREQGAECIRPRKTITDERVNHRAGGFGGRTGHGTECRECRSGQSIDEVVIR